MRDSKHSRPWAVAAAVLTLTLCGLPAFAARLIMPQVTGRVSAITSNVWVAVEGTQYQIGAGSEASKTIESVHLGDQVGLVFDGPVSNPGSHVVAIQRMSNP
jgi:hypothetical protein